MSSNSVKYQPLLNDLKYILTTHIKQIVDSIIEDYNQNFTTTENLYSLCNKTKLSDDLESNKLSLIHKSIECLNSSINTLNDKVARLEKKISDENIKLEISEISKQSDNLVIKGTSIPITPLNLPLKNDDVIARENEEIEIEEEEEEEEEEYEEDDDDDDDFELFEVVIGGVTFCTNDEKNGDIFELNDDESPGEKVGYYKDGRAVLNPI